MTATDPATLADFRARQERRRAEAYTRFFSPVTARFAGALVRRLGHPAGPALDLGCGDGVVTRELRAAGWASLALDISPELAAAALAGTGGPVVIGDALRLPLASASLAAAASAFVLPHLDDLDAALTETRRVLRRDGVLALAGWAPAAVSPFTGLSADLLRERAAATEERLLAEAGQRTDADHLATRLAAAGFAEVTVETATTVVRLPSPGHWWKGLVGGSCGFTELLQVQSREVQQATREAFLAEARDFTVGGEEVAVPAAALLIRGRAA
ncbi:class I SAM-dependent methyltransferase [Micromonospora chokoriensis]|uniref:class I SAM-dependent methyltransferase n=1 Tax=Micromonospora chokoriensis TaxID=356851 RepID=UPI00068EC63F|nr:class I SAM-dependent methyltransferase [Micromonospora chokoriensis]